MQILFIIINTVYIGNQVRERTKDKLKNDAQIIGEVLKTQENKDLQDILKVLDTRYTLLTKDGRVLFDSKNYKNQTDMDN
ncbi:MAG: hypothetical protein ACRCZ2_03025, partial [Fusobacteriaceae bacterium]